MCKIVVYKRRKVRNDFIKNNTKMTNKVFIRERKIFQSILQREERTFLTIYNRLKRVTIQKGELETFFRVIKQFKQFNLIGMEFN